MPVRQQSQQSAKHNATRGFIPPTTEDELLRSAPAAEADSSPLIQRAQTNPTALSARQVLQLQRTIGNRAVNNLLATNRQLSPALQRKTVQSAPLTSQRNEQDDEPITADNDQDADLETASSRQIDTVPVDTVQRGFFTRGKKNAKQGELSELTQTAKAGVTAGGVYGAVKRGMELLNGAKEAAGELFKNALTEFANLLTGLAIPGFVSLIMRIYELIRGWLEMKGMKDAHDKLAEKQKATALTANEENLKEASAHGFGKIKRRFYKAVYLVISSVVKITAHIITILSGGTAAMVSEMVALGATVLEGVKALYEKGKGFVKWLLNKRGVHRRQSADRILESAYSRDPIALQLLIDVDPMAIIGRQKRALKYGYGDPPTTRTPDEMYKLLMTFRDHPEKWGSELEYHEDLEKKLKST